MKIKQKDIDKLRRRYDLREEGMCTYDSAENAHLDTARVLESASTRFKGVDRLHFRQGFLFRAAQRG